MNKFDFAVRYCEGHETAYGYDMKGSCNCSELNYLLSRGIMIRRRKDQVLKELPPKSRDRVFLNVSDEYKNVMKEGLMLIKKAHEDVKNSGLLLLLFIYI